MVSTDAIAAELTAIRSLPYDDAAYLQGDPFDACVHDRGFGAASWDQARSIAMRHRMADPFAHHREELEHA